MQRRTPDRRRLGHDRRHRGVISVEMAISGVMFFAALLAVLDFGRMYFFQSRLTYAVSQATRFATMGDTLERPTGPGASVSRAQSISRMIRELSGFDDLGDDDIDIVHIGPGAVTVAGAGGPGDVVTVTASYRIDIMAPHVAALFDGGVFRISAATTARNEQGT